MKYFLSHKFTGLKMTDIEKDLSYLRSLLPKGAKYFCSFWLQNFFLENKMTDDEIYEYCLLEQKKCDISIFYIVSDEESKGMKLELDVAINEKQKIILIIKKNLLENQNFENFLKNADEIFSFENDIFEIKSIEK